MDLIIVIFGIGIMLLLFSNESSDEVDEEYFYNEIEREIEMIEEIGNNYDEWIESKLSKDR